MNQIAKKMINHINILHWILISLMCTLLVGCKKNELKNSKYQPIEASQIKLYVQGLSEKETGSDPFVVILTTPGTVEYSNQVTFKIEGKTGVFSNNSKELTRTIYRSDTIQVKVFSEEVGECTVTASLGGITKTLELEFIRAVLEFELIPLKINVPADNKSQAEVQVKIKDDQLFKNHDKVTFTLNQGKFSDGLKSKEVVIDVDSTAMVFITHDVGESIILTAQVGIYKKSISIPFLKLFDNVGVNLIGTSDTIVADNFQQAQIEAELINPVSGADFPLIRFRTTRGTFQNDLDSIRISPGNSGTKVLALLKSNSTGRAFVSVKTGGYEKNLEVIFTPEIRNFNLSTPVNNVPADGNSYAQINVKIESSSLNQSVLFSTNKGSFSDGSSIKPVNVGVDSIATVYLKNTQTGQAIVTASYFGQSKQTTVNFSTAWPDFISVNLTPNIISNSQGAVVNLEASLLRNSGTVTPNITVIWEDSVQTGVSPGTFLNSVPSNNMGKASVQYHIQDTSFSGSIYLKAKVITQSGNKIGSNKVFVQ